MRNPLTEELISAYLDGELTAEERAHVEQAVAESAECRHLFEELEALQASLQSLPRYRLPDDFHQRVLRQAERSVLAPEPDADRVARPTTLDQGSTQNTVRTWQGIALSAAVLAAALLFALIVVATRSGIRSPDVIPPLEDVVTQPGELAPPPDSLGSLDGEAVALPGEARTNRPKYVLVIDLTITPKGQRNRVFEDALKTAGIQFDPSLTVDEDLEQVLLNSRFLGGVKQAGEDAPKNEPAADDIEMVYVTGSGLQLDAAITDLMKKRPQDEIAWVRLDLAIEPNERAVFDRLNGAIRMADSEAEPSPRARRLVFRFSLRTASAGFLASIPTPVLTAELLPADEPETRPAKPSSAPAAALAKPVQQAGRGPVERAPQAGQEARQDPQAEMRYEVLFILRNLKEPSEPAVE